MGKPLITVALVEDIRLYAALTAQALEQEPEIDLVGISSSAADAGTMLRLKRPRIAIVDWLLGDGSGVEVIRELAPLLPNTRWLLASAHNCADLIFQGNAAGAQGVFDKETSGGVGELVNAVKILNAEGEYYAPASRALMRDAWKNRSLQLSDRQRQILKLLFRYKTRAEIARKLSLHPSTVAEHIAAIAGKLNLPEAPAISLLIAEAQKAGLLPKMPSCGPTAPRC